MQVCTLKLQAGTTAVAKEHEAAPAELQKDCCCLQHLSRTVRTAKDSFY